jgi:hypothetical protein
MSVARLARGVAVLVGVANMSTYVLIGSSETLAGDFASPEMRPYLPLYTLL